MRDVVFSFFLMAQFLEYPYCFIVLYFIELSETIQFTSSYLHEKLYNNSD